MSNEVLLAIIGTVGGAVIAWLSGIGTKIAEGFVGLKNKEADGLADYRTALAKRVDSLEMRLAETEAKVDEWMVKYFALNDEHTKLQSKYTLLEQQHEHLSDRYARIQVQLEELKQRVGKSERDIQTQTQTDKG